MQESFLHYLWKYQLHQQLPLTLTDGRIIEVYSAGEHNHDSGPDFFNAKIKIDDTLWAGNVEIHVNASEWLKHQHQNDKAYDNVILHVVANPDVDIRRESGEKVPVLQLIAPRGVYEQYVYLMQSQQWVPCESFIAKVDAFTILQWKEALLVERLSQKAQQIEERFIQNKNNWEETFYQSLAANFGFKTNSQPFEMLARSLPLIYLAKHKDKLPLIEALLFGQAGLIPENPASNYEKQLEADYRHLAAKFQLKSNSGHLWKFSKLRPVNFPTIRLAQFAALIYKSSSLLSKILEIEKVSDLHSLFTLQASEYWNTHYTFSNESPYKTKHLGNASFYNLVINTVVPFVFFYGKAHRNNAYTEKALSWLTEIPSEKNHIITHWNQLGLEVQTAFDTQALIQLKNNYCNFRLCLNCRIGNQVLRHRF
ncbi:MAG: DUF2851 domain-containing protein [Bacteroidetes bacterium HGW-Bacteroidetes-4]|jgi:hypothetical protein|nr:MAG: DUF2851 domain-containing protein [Bacteroidetes bacterium HGW-Bacteroidetes-4]